MNNTITTRIKKIIVKNKVKGNQILNLYKILQKGVSIPQAIISCLRVKSFNNLCYNTYEYNDVAIRITIRKRHEVLKKGSHPFPCKNELFLQLSNRCSRCDWVSLRGCPMCRNCLKNKDINERIFKSIFKNIEYMDTYKKEQLKKRKNALKTIAGA